jgi:hypothetical protein
MNLVMLYMGGTRSKDTFKKMNSSELLDKRVI